MKEIRCPDEYDFKNGNIRDDMLFLGGGISSCPQWQPEMVELLKDTDLVLINPRRDNFDITDPTMTEQQIKWEYKYLRLSAARLFWFPHETLCPITLFELGKFCERADPLFVGCHPDYKRKIDLEVQLGLGRPWNPEISYSLKDLAERVKIWAKRLKAE
jgi:hypothetical protein